MPERGLEVIRNVAALVERDPSLACTPGRLLHLVLDTIVDEYEPFLEQFIPERIDAIENALFSDQLPPPSGGRFICGGVT
jgi:Mg2+ and Co2+ transporter CorA